MKSLVELNNEASEMHLTIRRLLLNQNVFKDGLAASIAVVTQITTLRNQLSSIQREIRQRTPGDSHLS